MAAPAGRRGGELSSAQATLLLQEETLRRGERDRRALREKATALERSLRLAEEQRRAAQVGAPKQWGTRTPIPGGSACQLVLCRRD